MIRKITTLIVIFSIIFNSGLNEIIAFADDIYKKQVNNNVKQVDNNVKTADNVTLKSLKEELSKKLEKEDIKISRKSEALAYSDYEYKVQDGTITIIKCLSKETSITIPSSIDGMPVTVIGYRAFEGCENLINVNFSDNIKEIKEYAFNNVPLESLTLPSKLERIGDNVFNSAKLTKITISKALKNELNKSPFKACKNLEEVEFEEGMETIPRYILYNCKKVNKISIPSSVKVIGRSAFKGCESLTSFDMPDNIEEIQKEAFCNIEFESIKLPSNLRILGDCVFCSSKLTQINIPKTLENSLYKSPFERCKNLEEVKFEEGMETIPDYIWIYVNILDTKYRIF